MVRLITRVVTASRLTHCFALTPLLRESIMIPTLQRRTGKGQLMTDQKMSSLKIYTSSRGRAIEDGEKWILSDFNRNAPWMAICIHSPDLKINATLHGKPNETVSFRFLMQER